MGDRANVVVKDRESRVYLYTHWSGSELPETVRSALVRGQGRWSDGQYLARIIFCEMVKGSEMDTTGFGISAQIGDNEYPVLLVDCDKGLVTLEAEPDGSHAPKEPISLNIGDYAALKSASWDTLDLGRVT